jgi:hypothetical protein
MVRLERIIRVKNSLITPSPEDQAPEGFYIDRTTVRDHLEVHVRVPHTTRHDQKRSPLAHCKRVTLVTPPYVEQPQVQGNTPKSQDVIAEARTNLTLSLESSKNSSPNSETSFL